MGSKSLVLFILLALAVKVKASSCCSSSAEGSSIILGDYKAQLSLSISHYAVTHYADEDGQFKGSLNANQSILENITPAYSFLLTPYWQIGLSASYRLNTRLNTQRSEFSHGISEVKAQLTYEFLPETTYSLWRPRGFLFLEQTIPLAKSTYDATRPLRTDALSDGFRVTTLGATFQKTMTIWDFTTSARIIGRANKKFNDQGQSFIIKIRPSLAFHFEAGIRPFAADIRLGWAVNYQNEGRKEFSPGPISPASSANLWAVQLKASYLINNYAIFLNYSDQVFLAKATNRALGQSLALTFTKFVEI